MFYPVPVPDRRSLATTVVIVGLPLLSHTPSSPFSSTCSYPQKIYNRPPLSNAHTMQHPFPTYRLITYCSSINCYAIQWLGWRKASVEASRKLIGCVGD